jgi:hypothetical protein
LAARPDGLIVFRQNLFIFSGRRSNLMAGTRARFISSLRQLGICITIIALVSPNVPSAHAVVKIFDGFGDADRNNDGAIASYDTDWNDSGTFNDFTVTGEPPVYSGPDAALASRGITEVTAAQDSSDVGIVWFGSRSFDTPANLVKSKLRIINDNVAIGAETTADIHGDGLALGVESRGGGSSLIGRFGQTIELGPVAGDKVVVSVDWRVWREANDNASQPSAGNALRWGIYQDTDNEFGQTAPRGDGFVSSPPGETVMWGRDDGNWFSAAPGAEGDKGINTELPFGPAGNPQNARIRWEWNVLNINGGTNDGRILEGNAPSNTIGGGGGDTGTIALPGVSPDPGDGPGGVITDLSSFVPHTLKLEIVRLADGLAQVATFVDTTELLRDEIKTTDTGFNVLDPTPFTYDSFDYVVFRNATNDWDYVLDNFKVEVFGSNAGLAGDYNNDGSVNAADYVLWRKGTGTLANEVADSGVFSAADYTEWRARFGNPSGSGSSLDGASVPEPATICMFIVGAIALIGCTRQRSG